MADDFELDTGQLGALPVINAFVDRLGLAGLLDRFLPRDDARLKLAPATAIGVVVANLVIHRRPVYALGEWAAPFDPALFGLAPGETELLNDDRVGRMLARLFDADRASLLTRFVLDAIESFDIDVSQLHNDSTSISFAGSYAAADGRSRGGKPTAAIAHGHSKAHRPDLKQLVWILTVTADGAVPIAYRAVDGNTNDDITHEATWDGLVALTGRADFLYVADSKLATRANMAHIAGNKGPVRGGAARYPQGRPGLPGLDRRPHPRLGRGAASAGPPTSRSRRHLGDLSGAVALVRGYRIVWVRSSAKTVRDAETRRARIARSIAALDGLNQRLASPK